MSNEDRISTYLGDGVYAELEFGSILLKTERETGVHFIYLEPPEFDALINFAIKIGWLEKGQQLR